MPKNFLRHYYDVFQLLDSAEVQAFIGTVEYEAHKKVRFGSDDTRVANSSALSLENESDRKFFQREYEKKKHFITEDSLL